MATLGKAVIEFSADTAKFVGDVGRTAAQFEKSMNQMSRGVESIRNALLAAAGVGGFGMIIKSAIDAGDQLNKVSQKIGVSVERLSELRIGAALADVDVEAMAIGMKNFSRSIVEATDVNSRAARIFKQLGVDIRQGPEIALRQFADAMAGMEDGAVKTTVATELMGKSGMNLIPWLNQGIKGMNDMAETVRRMGLMMSTDFARQSETFNDNMKLLKLSTEALGISIGASVLPWLNRMLEQMRAGTEIAGGFANALRLFGLSSITSSNAGAQIQELGRELARLESLRANPPSGVGSEMRGRIDQHIGDLKKKLEFAKFLQRQAALELPGAGEPDVLTRRFGTARKMSADALARLSQILSSSDKENLSKRLAEEKRFLSAREALEIELGRMNARSALDELKRRKDLTEAHKVELTPLAVEVDLRRQLIDRVNKEYASRIELEEIKKQAEEAASTFFRAQREGIGDEKFRMEMLGRTAFEMQKLTKLREIDRAAVEAAGKVDSKRFPEFVTQIYAMAEVLKTQWIEALDASRAKQLDWHTGVVGALNDYRERVADMASQARDFVTGTFQTMEDKLVEFTTKGKLDFKGFVDSVIADLARIMIRRNITGPLSELSGGVFGDLFSGLFGVGTQAPAPVVDLSVSTRGMPGGHQGGIAGKLPRLHAGGLVGDETLAVLRRGEGVFTPEQMQALGPAGPTFFVDLRGASVDAVARLERFVASLHGSIESRAVAAVRDARARGR